MEINNEDWNEGDREEEVMWDALQKICFIACDSSSFYGRVFLTAATKEISMRVFEEKKAKSRKYQEVQ